MKTYKVHQAYINGNGAVIPVGEYDEDKIDLAEARAKSIVTLSSSNLETLKVELPDVVKIQKFNTESDIKTVKLEPTVTSTKVNSIKINSASYETIEEIKYVSKKNAERVLELREIKRFSSYQDLNKRVPLALSRKWEDLTSVDFEYVEPVVDQFTVTNT